MTTWGKRLRRPPSRLRLSLFLALLLLALSAPAGWIMDGDASRPFVVMLNQGVSTVADTAMPAGALADPFSFGNLSAAAGSAVDEHAAAQNVTDQVHQIETAERISATNIYAHVGAFTADLTPGQQAALAQDPAIAELIPDQRVRLDDGTPAVADALTAGTDLRVVRRANQRVPAGVRRVGAGPSTLAAAADGGRWVNADVAILDTGIQPDHPDLRVVGGYNCTSRNSRKWADNDGHGTHVAGIIGGMGRNGGVVGVAPGARLWSVKVLDADGYGWISWLVCGVDWVTAQRDPHNRQLPRFEVANMSISYVRAGGNNRSCRDQRADMLHKAICRSVAAGIVYVVAAGNESHDARRNRPAAYDQVITVGAIADYDGQGGGTGKVGDSCPYWTGVRDDTLARFSNYGPDLDFVAPGVCVLSTWKNSRYAYLSGTSMAAPHVAGAVAIYRAMYPDATPKQVSAALEAAGRLDWQTRSYPRDGRPPRALWVGNLINTLVPPDPSVPPDPAVPAVPHSAYMG